MSFKVLSPQEVEEMREAWGGFESRVQEKIKEYKKTDREASASGMKAALAILTPLMEPRESEEPAIVTGMKVFSSLAADIVSQKVLDLAISIVRNEPRPSTKSMGDLTLIALDDFQIGFSATLEAFQKACAMYPTLTLSKYRK